MSDIRATTISALNGTDPITLTKQHAAKMYASVNQQSVPDAIRETFNVSSITDNALAVTSFNHTNSFDGEVISSATLRDGGGENDARVLNGSNSVTPSFGSGSGQRWYCGSPDGGTGITLNEAEYLMIISFGDLA